MRLALDHLHLRSLDPEGAARWYESVLGARRLPPPDPKAGRVVLDLAGLRLFLDLVPERTLAAPRPPHLGMEHLGLGVSDLDAALAAARAAGATVANGPLDIRGVRIAFLDGPDGVVIELLERAAA
ncbi:VOC family protein [Roseomonas sp. CCTCC AB2023176]|uniref:VOC family protein n=1 Tax=Roseomonas sp. CCTCC AB2023176 TaxID=3342640 RepID=UPI0035DBF84A